MKPYIVLQEEDTNNFIGVVLTVGYVKEFRTFQIALTIGCKTLAIGIEV